MAKPLIQSRGSSPALPLAPNTDKTAYRAVPPTTVVIMNASAPEQITILPPVVEGGTTLIGIVPAVTTTPLV